MGKTTRSAIYIGEITCSKSGFGRTLFISDKPTSKHYQNHIYIHINQKQYKEQLASIDILHYVTQQ